MSAKREEVPLGCNLGEAVAISPMAFLLSGRVLRDCHVASLLAMTGLDGAVRDGRRGEGSESSAASGGKSEMSEWPRSKF